MTIPATQKAWRLDKFVSHTTELSRSQAKIVIKKGHIRVDEQVIKDVSYPVQEHHEVLYQQKHLKWPSNIYIMLHKPMHTVCALKDGQHQTVLDVLPDIKQEGLHIVGRLDIDTTGLLFLTTDGQWSHKITSPRTQCGKTYIVTTEQQIPEDLPAIFEQGIELHGERRKTSPAPVTLIGENQCEVIIYEGMYHQIKRMFAAQGLTVTALHRTRIGGLTLDSALSAGEHRQLSAEEVEAIFQDLHK